MSTCMGRIVQGWIIQGANRPWGKTPKRRNVRAGDETTRGRNIHKSFGSIHLVDVCISSSYSHSVVALLVLSFILCVMFCRPTVTISLFTHVVYLNRNKNTNFNITVGPRPNSYLPLPSFPLPKFPVAILPQFHRCCLFLWRIFVAQFSVAHFSCCPIFCYPFFSWLFPLPFLPFTGNKGRSVYTLTVCIACYWQYAHGWRKLIDGLSMCMCYLYLVLYPTQAPLFNSGHDI